MRQSQDLYKNYLSFYRFEPSVYARLKKVGTDRAQSGLATFGEEVKSISGWPYAETYLFKTGYLLLNFAFDTMY